MIRAADMSWRVMLLAYVVELDHKYPVIAKYTDTICCRVVK